MKLTLTTALLCRAVAVFRWQCVDFAVLRTARERRAELVDVLESRSV